jgi:tungstate transport system substrate-binding protein
MMASELDAYDLVDRATLRQRMRRAPLTVLVQGDPRLRNDYGVTTLRPAPGRPIHEREAQAFARWLVSDAARKLIAGYRIDGEPAFRLPE